MTTDASGRSLSARLSCWFFDGEVPEHPWILAVTARLARILGLAGMRFFRDRGQEKAAALAYATLLALLPVLVLAASLLEFLEPTSQDVVAKWLVSALFPKDAHDVQNGVLDYVAKSREAIHGAGAAGVGLRIAGTVMLLYFAANLMTGVDRMVGDIWGAGGIKAFIRRLTSYWSVMTLGPLLLALSLAGVPIVQGFLGESAGGVLTKVLPFVFTWLAAFAFFRLMPHTGAKTQAALVGAAVSGTLWEATKIAMGWYLTMPKSLLTALSFFPAAILWMYLSWEILIYGMEVTYIVHHGSWRPGRRARRKALGGRALDEIVVGVAAVIAREFDRGVVPDRGQIAATLRVGEDDVAVAVKLLVGAGLVVVSAEGGFRPARGTGAVPAVALVEAGRGASNTPALPAAARAFLTKLDESGGRSVADTTWHDLSIEEGGKQPTNSTS